MKDLQTQIQDVFAAGLHEGGEDFREGGKINTAPEGGVKFMSREDSTRIKEQIAAAVTILDNMDVVVSITSDGFGGLRDSDIAREVDKEFSKFGNQIDRQNFGIILLGYQQINKALNYLKTPGEKAALLTVPKVLKRGIEIDSHSKHKDRGVDSYTFAAPVEINGVRGNVGVVVQRVAGTNRFKTLRIVLPNGKAFEFIKNNEADSTTGSSSKPKSSEGIPIESASRISIRNSAPKVNKNSLRYQKNEAAQSHMAEQNDAMAEDVKSLNDLVAAQKQGKVERIRKSTTETAAAYLMKIAGAKGEKSDLADLLSDFYTYVATSTEQTWESIREKALPVVRWLMDNTVRTKQRSDYAQDILNTLHNSRVRLDETQRGEVAHVYGSFSAFRNTVMGSIILVNDGISLDSQWQEWAEMYPDVFDKDMNAADMPEALSDIIRRMRNDNTSELEYEYNREFIEQELLSRVYDSYWNASTLYSVADHYESKIKQLKAKHRQRMQAVYVRQQTAEAEQREVFKRRQEKAAAHFEERYERREAEYRESRRQAVERHDKAQVRQQIRKDVQRLDSLLNKGTKEKNVKLELQEFAGAALRTAKGTFLKNYNEYDMVRNGVNVTMSREQKVQNPRHQSGAGG